LSNRRLGSTSFNAGNKFFQNRLSGGLDNGDVPKDRGWPAVPLVTGLSSNLIARKKPLPDQPGEVFLQLTGIDFFEFDSWPLKRSIIQAVITATALREGDVHTIINERVRRYAKLRRRLGFHHFCLPNRMLVCLVGPFVNICVSMPGRHRCTKRQAGDDRHPHVCPPLVRSASFTLLGDRDVAPMMMWVFSLSSAVQWIVKPSQGRLTL
jgi:hypothetical protein